MKKLTEKDVEKTIEKMTQQAEGQVTQIVLGAIAESVDEQPTVVLEETSGSKDIDKLLEGVKVLWCEEVRLQEPGTIAFGSRCETLLNKQTRDITDIAYVVSSGAVMTFGPLTDSGRTVRVFNDVRSVKLLPGGKREKDKGGRPRKEA